MRRIVHRLITILAVVLVSHPSYSAEIDIEEPPAAALEDRLVVHLTMFLPLGKEKTVFQSLLSRLKLKADFTKCASTRAVVSMPSAPSSDARICLLYQKIGNYDAYSPLWPKQGFQGLMTIAPESVLIDIEMQEFVAKLLKDIAAGMKSLGGQLLDFHQVYPKPASAGKPNFLFIVADDLGYGDLSYNNCKGASTPGNLCTPDGVSPNLDKLAKHKNTIVLDRFYAHVQCGPSRAAIIFGMDPSRLGIVDNPNSEGSNALDTIPTTLPSLARSALKAGYQTIHVGKWNLGNMESKQGSATSNPGQLSYGDWFATETWVPTYGANCGCFERCDNLGVYADRYFLDEYERKDGRKFLSRSAKNFQCQNYLQVTKVIPSEDGVSPNKKDPSWNGGVIAGDDAAFIVDKFKAFLENMDQDKPFFATLWFHDPHAPFVNKEGSGAVDKARSIVATQKGAGFCGELFDFNYPPVQKARPSCIAKFGASYCESLCKEIKAQYYASILTLDKSVGDIRSLVEDSGLKDNTILIFSSDNGPARWDRSGDGARYVAPGSTAGLPGRKFEFREGGLRVPAMIYFPQVITNNRVVKMPTGNVDIYPTLLDILQEEVLTNQILDGISLLPMLQGLELPREKPIGYKTGNNGFELLMFHDITVTNKAPSKSLKFFNITQGGRSAKVETAVVIPPALASDFAARYNGWSSSYSLKGLKG